MVFSTKHRLPSITAELKGGLHAYLGGIVKNIDGFPFAIGGIEDHVHLLISVPPRIALADAVRTIKTNSSKWIHEVRQIDHFQWQAGYAAFTVSESVRPTVIEYIQNQAEHHRRQGFQAELRTLLIKHGIDFDEKYLWD